MAYDPHVTIDEVNPEPYCQRGERFVVSLLVSYDEADAETPQRAAAYDRQTGVMPGGPASVATPTCSPSATRRCLSPAACPGATTPATCSPR